MQCSLAPRSFVAYQRSRQTYDQARHLDISRWLVIALLLGLEPRRVLAGARLQRPTLSAIMLKGVLLAYAPGPCRVHKSDNSPSRESKLAVKYDIVLQTHMHSS